MSGTTLFGVPIDCVGEPVGTTRTPGVLRGAGVVDALGAHDLGDLDVSLGPTERDPTTGIVGSASVLELTRTVADSAALPVSSSRSRASARAACWIMRMIWSSCSVRRADIASRQSGVATVTVAVTHTGSQRGPFGRDRR